MGIKILLLIFFLNLSLINNYLYYQPKDVINYLNKNITSKDKLENIKASLLKTLNETYALYEISKNPPQPDYDNNYYNKVNISEELNGIKTENRSFYQFYQDLIKVLNKLKTHYLSLIYKYQAFYPLLSELTFYCPISLIIKMDKNNKPLVFAKLKGNKNFKNYGNIRTIIKNNVNNTILSINGKNPFDYVTELGIGFFNLSNPHATFNYKFYYYNKFTLNILPLDLDELTNFKVVYSNQQTFTTDYIIQSINVINFNKNIVKNNKVYSEEVYIKNSFFFNNIIKNYKFDFQNGGDKIIRKLQQKYSYQNIIRCQVDDNNGVNIYIVHNFDSAKEEIINVIENCALLFDKNIYPVIFITNRVSGNSALFSQFILETLSPLITTNFYGAYRASYNLSQYYDTKKYNSETCNLINVKQLFDNRIKIDYGNNVEDALSQPFILNGQDFRKRINSIKSKLTKPRNPTDIIVYTDGYSFSAKSLFINYLQFYGGGITVGFFGNPNKKNYKFDSSLSSSIIYSHNKLKDISYVYKKLYEEYGFSMNIPLLLTFYNPNNLTIPIEYEITPVDEIVDIYEYPSFDNDNYSEFINEANEIFKKYKNKCNPNNKKLLLIHSKCDMYFNNNYTHGGYECGDDGIWSDKCVPSYCDQGYIFDYIKKECILDYCDEKNRNDNIDSIENDKNGSNLVLIILLPIIIIIIILLIIFIILRIRKKRNSQSNFESIAKFSLVLQDY